ncbi:MAG: hypothetical protein RIS29_2462 [Bacteroidota bacterium]|jgi:hypothetical protein
MYEDIFNLVGDFGGKFLYPKSVNSAVGYDYPKLTADGTKYKIVTISISMNVYLQLTGRFFSMKDDICYQVKIYGLNSQPAYGYILSTDLEQWTATKPGDANKAKAQNLIDNIIGSHQTILESNLMCARILNYCKENAIVLPADARQRLYMLQTRLINRNEFMKNSGDLTNIQEAESPNFSMYNDELTNFMDNPGIGVIPIVAIVVVAVVLAATAIVSISIYKKFLPIDTEAKADVKYSTELEAQLIKFLPPDTYAKLKAENAANAADWQKKLEAASGKAWINTAKYVGIGVLAIWAFDKFNSNLSYNKR